MKKTEVVVIAVLFPMAIWLSLSYLHDQMVPIELPLVLISLVVFLGLRDAYIGKLSYFTFLMLAFFCAPVLPLFAYFFEGDVNWGWTPEMRAGIDHSVNLKIAIALAVGSIGLLIGSYLSTWRRLQVKPLPTISPAIPIIGYATLCSLAILLSYASAPTSTIFAGQYGGEALSTFAVYINFPGAYLVSYSIFILLAVDAVSHNRKHRVWKMMLLVVSVLFVAVFFQFMRGDREISGLLLSFLIFYIVRPFFYQGPYPLKKRMAKRRARKAVKFVIPVGFFLLALGVWRFTASYGIFDLTNIFRHTPWVMTLTTFPAFFSSELSEEMLWGRTYIEYVLSLPPGIVTNMLGVRRAIEADANLATYLVATGMTSGGAHVALVGLANFSVLGLLLVMTVYGWFSRWLERRAVYRRGIYLLIWLNLIAVLPVWFWYGEMAAVRAVMAAVITYFIWHINIFSYDMLLG